VNTTLTGPPRVAHEHHERILRHVDRLPRIADLVDKGFSDELKSSVEETADFLNELLLPHMAAAERAFYPELERQFQNRHSMTPMRHEHERIRAAITEVTELRRVLRDGHFGTGEAVRLRRALLGLYALVKVHLAEELLYARLVERRATLEDEHALADAMAHSGTVRF
jgi:iron-sulfur cluster repair protein YtfE (RIC family)